MGQQRRTVNIHCGKKLSGKSRDEILDAVLGKFQNVEAVQQKLDVIRVSFNEEEHALAALRERGVRLFDMWCRMDGGPPATIVHLFDYPYEDPTEDISAFFADFGVVKGVCHQKYLRNGDIATGTRLVDIVLSETPPRLAIINGSTCRVWYRGQPVLCNICATLGHKAVNCPYKSKCRLCQQEGHFAWNCRNSWGSNVSESSEGSSSGAPVDGEVSRGVDPSRSQDSSGAPADGRACLVTDSSGVQTSLQATVPGGSSDPPVDSLLLAQVTDAIHDSSGAPANSGAQSLSGLDGGSFGVQASLQDAPSGGSSDPPVDPHPPAQVVQPRSDKLLQTDCEDLFVDASDGSDIEEFTESSLPSSQSISEFSQSQSILRNAQDVRNDGVVPGTVVVPTVVDVDSMDPSLVSLKRRSDSSVDFRRPRHRSPGSRRKHRRVASASPLGRGQHRGLPPVVRDRPSKD